MAGPSPDNSRLTSDEALQHQYARRLWFIMFPLAWIFYRLTMAPGVLWGDAGHAQLHTALDGWIVEGQLARSHVLYFIIARALHLLAGFDAATASNLVSTIGGAVTVANMALLTGLLSRTRLTPLVAAGLTLFAHTHWRLSVSAEVVTLTTALLTAELICLVRLVQTGRAKWLAVALLFNGLGFANHNFALLMWSVYVLLAIRFRTSLHVRHGAWLAAGAALWLMGAAPILLLCYMDLQSHGQFGATLKSLLLGSYSGKVTNLARLPRLFAQTIAYTILNFPTPLLLLAPWGIARLRRVGTPPIAWLLLAAFMVYLLFGMRYDVPDQYTFLVPAFLFMALFIALGVEHVMASRPSIALRAGLMVCVGLAPLVYAALPPVLRRIPAAADFLPRREVPHRDRYAWFLRPWLTGYDGAERFARETLDLLPPWAVLAVDSTLVAPINYLQFTQSVRKDVRLDCWAAQQHWLAEIDWDAERAAAIREGRLFATSDDPKYQPPWLREGDYTLTSHGMLFKVSR